MQVRTLLLIITCWPVFSLAQWKLLSESYLGNVYLDSESHEKKELYYFVWQLQDFNTEDKRGVKSRRILNKINCQTGERRIIYSTSHSEHMGEGIVLLGGITQSSWTEPLPKSVGAELISKVCN
ncbi:hypothetical protein N9V13_00595 [Betaproteobacteria bacterium]|nr:hypothetical protein [Betaproteobacteria bacterium]